MMRRPRFDESALPPALQDVLQQIREQNASRTQPHQMLPLEFHENYHDSGEGFIHGTFHQSVPHQYETEPKSAGIHAGTLESAVDRLSVLSDRQLSEDKAWGDARGADNWVPTFIPIKVPKQPPITTRIYPRVGPAEGVEASGPGETPNISADMGDHWTVENGLLDHAWNNHNILTEIHRRRIEAEEKSGVPYPRASREANERDIQRSYDQMVELGLRPHQVQRYFNDFEDKGSVSIRVPRRDQIVTQAQLVDEAYRGGKAHELNPLVRTMLDRHYAAGGDLRGTEKFFAIGPYSVLPPLGVKTTDPSRAEVRRRTKGWSPKLARFYEPKNAGEPS